MKNKFYIKLLLTIPVFLESCHLGDRLPAQSQYSKDTTPYTDPKKWLENHLNDDNITKDYLDKYSDEVLFEIQDKILSNEINPDDAKEFLDKIPDDEASSISADEIKIYTAFKNNGITAGNLSFEFIRSNGAKVLYKAFKAGLSVDLINSLQSSSDDSFTFEEKISYLEKILGFNVYSKRDLATIDKKFLNTIMKKQVKSPLLVKKMMHDLKARKFYEYIIEKVDEDILEYVNYPEDLVHIKENFNLDNLQEEDKEKLKFQLEYKFLNKFLNMKLNITQLEALKKISSFHHNNEYLGVIPDNEYNSKDIDQRIDIMEEIFEYLNEKNRYSEISVKKEGINRQKLLSTSKKRLSYLHRLMKLDILTEEHLHKYTLPELENIILNEQLRSEGYDHNRLDSIFDTHDIDSDNQTPGGKSFYSNSNNNGILEGFLQASKIFTDRELKDLKINPTTKCNRNMMILGELIKTKLDKEILTHLFTKQDNNDRKQILDKAIKTLYKCTTDNPEIVSYINLANDQPGSVIHLFTTYQNKNINPTKEDILKYKQLYVHGFTSRINNSPINIELVTKVLKFYKDANQDDIDPLHEILEKLNFNTSVNKSLDNLGNTHFTKVLENTILKYYYDNKKLDIDDILDKIRNSEYKHLIKE